MPGGEIAWRRTKVPWLTDLSNCQTWEGAIQNKTASAYLLNIHNYINESSQHQMEQSWALPKVLTCKLGANKWFLFQTIKNCLVPLCLSLFLWARTGTWGWGARVGYVEEDKAWRKLAGQKQGVFYLTRIDQIRVMDISLGANVAKWWLVSYIIKG